MIKKAVVTLALCLSASWGADLLVQRAQMWGPNGPAEGKLVMMGDRMVFVDDIRPEMSFVIPRSDVRSADWEGGRLTIDVRNPYVSSFGPNQSTLVLAMPDPTSAGTVVTWMGVPVAGYTGEASRVVTGDPNVQVTDVTFDVKNGDQRGKLLVRPMGLWFESLSDARHSAHWAWADIREFTHNDHEIKVQPFHGDKYEFQFRDPTMLNTAYQVISDRLVAARANGVPAVPVR